MENKTLIKTESNTKKIRIAWNKGKKKPIEDEHGIFWCNCKNPKLTTHIGRGYAFCLLCKTPWYH